MMAAYQTVQLDFAEVVAKLKSKEFTTRKRTGSHFRSDNWSLFEEIVSHEGIVVRNFVFCTGCGKVITYNSANGTNNLTRHKKTCSVQSNKLDSYVINKKIDFSKRDRDNILSASERFCYEDLRPFQAIEGNGWINLLGTVSAITVRNGLLSADTIKILLPAPTTVSSLFYL